MCVSTRVWFSQFCDYNHFFCFLSWWAAALRACIFIFISINILNSNHLFFFFGLAKRLSSSMAFSTLYVTMWWTTHLNIGTNFNFLKLKMKRWLFRLFEDFTTLPHEHIVHYSRFVPQTSLTKKHLSLWFKLYGLRWKGSNLLNWGIASCLHCFSAKLT